MQLHPSLYSKNLFHCYIRKLQKDGKITNYSITQSGEDRGDFGKHGSIPEGDDKGYESYSSTTFDEVTEYEQDKGNDPFEEGEENKQKVGRVSGSLMREISNTFDISRIEDSDFRIDIRKFILNLKFGNMTIIDVFCILNDIRIGKKSPKIRWKDFWSTVPQSFFLCNTM